MESKLRNIKSALEAEGNCATKFGITRCHLVLKEGIKKAREHLLVDNWKPEYSTQDVTKKVSGEVL